MDAVDLVIYTLQITVTVYTNTVTVCKHLISQPGHLGPSFSFYSIISLSHLLTWGQGLMQVYRHTWSWWWDRHKADIDIYIYGAGIAQWLERRTRDWKVTGSNPCWNGGRIFFSRVDFLCWLLFRYPFHPRVTAVARKKSRSFCQKCRWQVTAKHAYTLRMWLLLNRASALVTTCP